MSSEVSNPTPTLNKRLCHNYPLFYIWTVSGVGTDSESTSHPNLRTIRAGQRIPVKVRDLHQSVTATPSHITTRKITTDQIVFIVYQCNLKIL